MNILTEMYLWTSPHSVLEAIRIRIPDKDQIAFALRRSALSE